MNFLYSIGNKKIGKDTLIFNMNSATNCPSRKRGLCKHAGKCYAIRAERLYPQCLPYRNRQADIWNKMSVNNIVKQITKLKHIKYVRFSEAGDFRKQADVNKMNRLANALSPYKIKLYGYTARRDLSFKGLSKNININGSGFMVTNKYTTVNEFSKNAVRCKCDCKTCNICATARNKNIEVLFH